MSFVVSIIPGAQYGYRKSRQLGSPLECIEVISKVKPGKWKVKFIGGPNSGLVDYTHSGSIVVDWSEADAFLNDELRLQKVIEASGSQWNGDNKVAAAINTVLNSTGDWDACLSDYGSRSTGTAYLDLDAARRIVKRARLDPDPLKLDPDGFVDRHGGLHLAFDACLTMAKAFARAEPTTVLMYVDSAEQDYLRRNGDSSYMADSVASEKAANILAREWTESPEADRRLNIELDELRRSAIASIDKLHLRCAEIEQQKTEEILRLRALVLEATDVLRTLQADDKADKLLLEINRPTRPKR